jgi:peptidyl-tRNA hydrolase
MLIARSNRQVKMVFAVRTDLKMKPGKMCAQVAHAAVEAAKMAEGDEPQLLELWETHGCAKICLKVRPERFNIVHKLSTAYCKPERITATLTLGASTLNRPRPT